MSKELTNKTDDPLFWILREAYAEKRNETTRLESEIEHANNTLIKLQHRLDRTRLYMTTATNHAATLGWSLELDWEKTKS